MANKPKPAKTIPAASVFEKADVKEPGVAAVDRALSIMCAFTTSDTSLSLHEIAARTDLYKSTILRLGKTFKGQDLPIFTSPRPTHPFSPFPPHRTADALQTYQSRDEAA
jgi:hypothetical protein